MDRKTAKTRRNINDVSPTKTIKSTPEERVLAYWESLSGSRKALLEPFIYVAKIPKQQIRSPLIHWINIWTKLPEEQVEIIDDMLSMIFEMIVIQDDIEDESSVRRGIPAAHKIYGRSRTYKSSCAVLLEVVKRLGDLKNLEVFQIFSEELLLFFDGQYAEIAFRDTHQCPTIEEYMELSLQKLRGASNMFINIMKHLSGCKKDFSKFVDLYGIWYCLVNDYSNLFEKQYWDIKGSYDDIWEGKFNIAVTHAINTNTVEGDIVYNIIRSREKDETMVKYCITLLEKLGSKEYIEKQLVDLEKQLREELKNLGDDSLLAQTLDKQHQSKSDEILLEETTSHTL